MKIPAPHFLLISESSRKQRQGQWRFKLQAVDGSAELEASDAEPDIQGERLELLAVVRGLEALDQPSRVTLVTPSKYVHRGLVYGLDEWRTNGWSWEHFGQMVPVKNRDLWQRLDRAMSVHELEFQPWRWDAAHSATSPVVDDAPLAASQFNAAGGAAATHQQATTGDQRGTHEAHPWRSAICSRWRQALSSWGAVAARSLLAYLRVAGQKPSALDVTPSGSGLFST